MAVRQLPTLGAALAAAGSALDSGSGSSCSSPVAPGTPQAAAHSKGEAQADAAAAAAAAAVEVATHSLGPGEIAAAAAGMVGSLGATPGSSSPAGASYSPDSEAGMTLIGFLAFLVSISHTPTASLLACTPASVCSCAIRISELSKTTVTRLTQAPPGNCCHQLPILQCA